jgi:two-component system KDP operon response regulator KdpE
MTKQGHSQTILVADDEAEIADLVRMVLEWEGYVVLKANNGAEALALARESVPDLIFLDVRMPKMTGLDVLVQLQADTDLAYIPVVMLSVVTTYPQVQTALQKGAVAFLPKPFELGEMTRLVKNILSQDGAGLEVIRQHALRTLSVQL